MRRRTTRRTFAALLAASVAAAGCGDSPKDPKVQGDKPLPELKPLPPPDLSGGNKGQPPAKSSGSGVQ